MSPQINSAGVLAPVPGIKSHDTLDMAFSVNYLAPALLTHLLLPVLWQNGGSIVHVTCKEYAKIKELDLGFFTHQAEEADSQGMLRVTIERGKNICYGGTRSNKFTSPIIELDISGEKYTTTRKNNTKSPVWNETFTKKTTELPKSVSIEVFDGKPVSELSLGTAEIPLSGLTYTVGTLDSTFVVRFAIHFSLHTPFLVFVFFKQCTRWPLDSRILPSIHPSVGPSLNHPFLPIIRSSIRHSLNHSFLPFTRPSFCSSIPFLNGVNGRKEGMIKGMTDG